MKMIVTRKMEDDFCTFVFKGISNKLCVTGLIENGFVPRIVDGKDNRISSVSLTFP